MLSEWSQTSGGHYYLGIPAATGGQGETPVARRIEDRTEVTFVTGAADRQFEKNLMTGLVGLLVGLLSVEWLVRRLCRLA